MPLTGRENSAANSAMSDRAACEYDGCFLDLDGTLYSGNRLFDGVPEAIDELRRWELPVRFVTNNAAATAAEVAERLRNLGYRAGPSEVYTSSHAAAAMLAERLSAGASVLVLGTDALAGRVRDAGLRPVREAGQVVDAVVQGHNPDTGWRELAEACVAIRAGAWWLACNTDVTLPSERGELPGNGAMVTALRVATGVTPDVAGKPQAPLLTLAARESGCENPLVVGDRLETDIAGAHAAGMDALAVLSGVSTPRRLLGAAPVERPRYVAADVTCLTGTLAEFEIGSHGDTATGWRVKADDDCLAVSGESVEPANGSGARFAPATLALLRALCEVAWSSGITATRAEDDRARQALTALGLLEA